MKTSHPFLMCAFLSAAAACSARGGPGGLTPNPSPLLDASQGTGPDAADPGPTGDACNALCARVITTSGCTNSMDDCLRLCAMQVSVVPASCQAQLNTLFDCGRSSGIQCSGSSVTFPACMTQQQALVSCIGSGPRPDGGTTPVDASPPPRDGGGTDPCADARDCASCTGRSECGWCANRCWQGTSSGPRGGSCGGTPWAWTSSMCSSTPPPDAGGTVTMACQNCVTEACPDELSACLGNSQCFSCLSNPASPGCASNAQARAVLSCACESCGSTCSGFCG